MYSSVINELSEQKCNPLKHFINQKHSHTYSQSIKNSIAPIQSKLTFSLIDLRELLHQTHLHAVDIDSTQSNHMIIRLPTLPTDTSNTAGCPYRQQTQATTTPAKQLHTATAASNTDGLLCTLGMAELSGYTS